MPEQLHFLQPLWLLALIPLALLVWRLRHATADNNPWTRIIDARLQSLLLMGQTQPVSHFLLWLTGLGWLIATLALANPVWEKQPRPLFQTSAAQVIVLDLSRSMLNHDLKPSRLARARFKIEDILGHNEEGQTGLVVFAGDAFTVTPLTRDADTIRALLNSLDPELMPVQGSRADLGLQQAGELLQQAGLSHGQILLLADGVSGDKARDVAETLHSKGYRVSVLGVGTENPEPLTNAQGQLLRTQDDQLILPPLETRALKAVAEAGGGHYRRFNGNGDDITTLLSNDTVIDTENPITDDLQGQDWQSRGPWLAVLLLPLAALAFRRGWLLSVVLVVGVLLPPQPAMALGWDDLWQRPDQQASKALAEKDYPRASQVAKDPLLRGSAEYRRGNYEQALEAYSQASGTIADYDRGNALAKLGRYEEAIAAYNDALKSAPGMEDAQANKAAIEALLRQQQQQSDQPQKQQTEEGNEGDSEKSQQSESSSQDQQQAGSGEQSAQDNQSASDEQSQQDKNDQQEETSQDSGENTFADAAKALEEEQADDASKEQERTAGTASEKSTEKQSENNDPPSPPEQQTAQADDSPTRAQTLSSEEQMAAEQWLRRIPDDPGGLLRRKFQYQYQRRAQRKGTGSAQPW